MGQILKVRVFYRNEYWHAHYGKKSFSSTYGIKYVLNQVKEYYEKRQRETEFIKRDCANNRSERKRAKENGVNSSGRLKASSIDVNRFVYHAGDGLCTTQPRNEVESQYWNGAHICRP